MGGWGAGQRMGRGRGAGGVALPSLRSARRCRAPAGAEARLSGEPVASPSQAGAGVRRARVRQGQEEQRRVLRTRGGAARAKEEGRSGTRTRMHTHATRHTHHGATGARRLQA